VLAVCAGGATLPHAAAQDPIVFPQYAYDALESDAEPAPVVGGTQLGFEHGQLVSYMVPEDLQRQRTSRALREEESRFAGYFDEEAATPEMEERRGPVEEEESSREIESRGSADTGTALADSPSIQTLNVQRRSSIAFDPRIRGFHIGQVWAQAEGVYWTPVRQDLDSMLSRIDPRMIDDLRVVPGPYAARYGPGFAFIDIDLADTPRYDCPQSHNRLGYVFRGNGSQQYAIDTFYGGGADYGYIINYSFRNGADYLAGNGQRIPSSYLVNSVSTQFGFDLSSGARMELRYDFLDQGYTQIPGQFFDIDNLQTNAFAVSLIDDSQTAAWTQMRIDAWHNNTPTNGTVRNDAVFEVRDRVETALLDFFQANPPPGGTPTGVDFAGTTSARLMASGGRWEYTFGEADSLQLTTGVDVRHVRQRITENFLITDADPPNDELLTIFPTQLPPSEMFNPGAYAEVQAPMTYYWTASAGARVDYVQTYTNGIDPNETSQLFPDDLNQTDTLYSLYMMNEVKLTENLIAMGGFGYAQRPPTLLERYADGVFVSIIQSGFTRVIGSSTLDPEKLYQADAGLAYNFCNTRASVNVYHSWIQDFITFRGLQVNDPTGARLIRYVPTDLATIWGGEAKYEYDLSSTWTFLAAGHYVQGQDQTIDAPNRTGGPLWGISPLEGTAGLRWHTADDPNYMGLELLARFVANQNRLGIIRLGNDQTVGSEPFELETPGFTTVNVRCYYNPSDNLSFIAGIENLLDKTYLQHLDNRLQASNGFPAAFAYAPGFTPYIGVDWEF
jgi:outer membrane receptor protein involved in Fe transport